MGILLFGHIPMLPIYIGLGVLGVFLLIFLRLKFGSLPGSVYIEVPAPNDPSGVNRTRAQVQEKTFQFAPFLAKGPGIPLKQAGLRNEEELLVYEKDGQKHLYVAREMAYHHVAQNELAGEPYMVSF